MKYFVLLITLLSFAKPVPAQENQRFLVKTGEIIIQRIPHSSHYRFDQVRLALVHFLKNTTAFGYLNYNLLYGEIQFIDPARDAVSLANEQMIERISFEDTDYVFDPENNRYLEVLA